MFLKQTIQELKKIKNKKAKKKKKKKLTNDKSLHEINMVNNECKQKRDND